MDTVVHVMQLILDREGRSPLRSRGQQSGRMTRSNEIKRNSCSARVLLSAINSRPASHHLLRPLWQQQPKLWHIPNSSSKDRLNQRLISRIASVLALIKTLQFFPPLLHARAKKKRMTGEPGIPSTTTTYQDIIIIPSVVAGQRDAPQLCFVFSMEDCQLFLSSLICWLSLFQTIKSLKFNGKKKNDTSGDDIRKKLANNSVVSKKRRRDSRTINTK